MNILKKLEKAGLLHCPKWLVPNLQYLTLMGSEAYGVASGDSDKDIYGFAIPPKEIVFPHLAGEIFGFGRQIERFNQYQEHHILEEDKNWDISIYGIVRFFQLLMDNNPNIIDSMFTPQSCILHSTTIGNMVRENRKMFLHKGCFHKLKGYSFSQLHKAATKRPVGKRKEQLIDGKDCKFLYHVVRLLSQCEQILMEGDLDLQEKGRREHMKAIRNGEVSQQEVEEWFSIKEKTLEKLYAESKLPYGPDEDKIKQLLLDCLEHHYGSLEKVITIQDPHKKAPKDIIETADKYRSLL